MSSAADVQNALGEVLLRSGDSRSAIAKFERAAELDPNEAAYRLNLQAARQEGSKSDVKLAVWRHFAFALMS
jgi:Flp pilus assembly protein TadD